MALELLDEETQALVDRVQKLLRLAANNPSAEERAAAEAKAHEWLLKFNLDMGTVEQYGDIENGKRADEKLKGGHFEYQRDLWKAVAKLNFCMYWNQVARIEEKKFMPNRKKNAFRQHIVVRHERQHRIVGRIHNIILTRTMCEYMEAAVERVVEKEIKGTDEQRRGEWANSLRRGCFERIVERIEAKRRQMEREDRQKQAEAAERAKTDPNYVSTNRSITLADLAQKEADANNDFIVGEDGFSARMRAENAQRQIEQAKAREEADAYWTQYWLDHPEEAKAEAARERKRQASADYYWRTRGQYTRERGYSSDFKGDRQAHAIGREAGEHISIDAQTAGRGKQGRVG